MTSFDSEIMNSLMGNTPRQKFEYLKDLLDALNNRRYLCDLQAHLIEDVQAEAYPEQYREIASLNDEFNQFRQKYITRH